MHGARKTNRPLGRMEIAVWTAAIGGCLFWSLAQTLEEMRQRWMTDPKYSHGWLVVGFALALLWTRRDRFAWAVSRPNVWGLGLIAMGLAMQIAGAVWVVDWWTGLSLIPCLAGSSVLLLGWRSLIWSGPAIAFLTFMVPLPPKLETAMSAPLQTLAARASAATLQLLGQPAVRDGNVLRIETVEIGVAEACSGLAMLMTFLAVSAAVALLSRKPWPHRLTVLLAAVPIAILSNVIRIAVTGVLNVVANDRVARLVFHDLAGWLMMPLALGLLWLILAFLDRLIQFPALQTIPVSGATPAVAKPNLWSTRGKPFAREEVC